MPIKKSGFTLIELLVTMTIVTILSVIGLSTYLGAQSKARDSQRLDDAKKIVIALEQYKSGAGYYPKIGTADWLTVSPPTKSIWISGLDGSNFIGNVLPSDPKNSNSNRLRYYYRGDVNGVDYCLQIPQENNAEGHPYYKGHWPPGGGTAALVSSDPWQLRFGPSGSGSGLCGSVASDSP